MKAAVAGMPQVKPHPFPKSDPCPSRCLPDTDFAPEPQNGGKGS